MEVEEDPDDGDEDAATPAVVLVSAGAAMLLASARWYTAGCGAGRRSNSMSASTKRLCGFCTLAVRVPNVVACTGPQTVTSKPSAKARTWKQPNGSGQRVYRRLPGRGRVL